jgi:hypothetical protein
MPPAASIVDNPAQPLKLAGLPSRDSPNGAWKFSIKFDPRMSVDSSLVDRIVRGVLHGLQDSPTTAAPAPKPKSTVVSSSAIRLSQAIITAEVLETAVPKGSRQITIGPKAILTPAALDVIRSRHLWIQRESTSKATMPATTRRLAIVVRSTPALDRLLLAEPGAWRRELLVCPDDAATLATSSICRGDADVIAIFAQQHYRAACRANRNDRVRGVALKAVDELAIAASQLRVNTVCIDPTGRPEFELRRWLDAISKLSEPAEKK